MATVREFGGLDNQNPPSDYGMKRLSVADNVDITRNSKIVTRKGRIRIGSASIDAACATKNAILYQADSSLYLIDDHSVGNVVKSGLNPSDYLAAAEVNGKIVWSNGIDKGVVFAGASVPLGINSPNTPVIVPIFGSMPSGLYLYAVTYTRADGYESGARLSGQIELGAGGVSLTMPSSAPADVAAVNLYLSTVNGDTLYLAASAPVGSVVTYTGNTNNLQVPLDKLGCDAPPPFQAACLYRGRMYYLHGNVLWASRPYDFECVDYAQDFVVLPETGVMCASVDDGVYVATANKTYFLRGSDPQDFVMDSVGDGAIGGTAVDIDAIGDRPRGVMWASNRGAVAGLNGGQTAVVTDGVFAYGDAGAGCGVLREQNGQRHFVVSLRGESVPYNARQISILANIEAPMMGVLGIG